MSSEESESHDVIEVHPLPWRSDRVTKFLHSFDEKTVLTNLHRPCTKWKWGDLELLPHALNHRSMKKANPGCFQCATNDQYKHPIDSKNLVSLRAYFNQWLFNVWLSGIHWPISIQLTVRTCFMHILLSDFVFVSINLISFITLNAQKLHCACDSFSVRNVGWMWFILRKKCGVHVIHSL